MGGSPNRSGPFDKHEISTMLQQDEVRRMLAAGADDANAMCIRCGESVSIHVSKYLGGKVRFSADCSGCNARGSFDSQIEQA